MVQCLESHNAAIKSHLCMTSCLTLGKSLQLSAISFLILDPGIQ